MGRELHSVRDGKRVDHHLHGPILANPDAHLLQQARAVRDAVRRGMPHREALALYGHDLLPQPETASDDSVVSLIESNGTAHEVPMWKHDSWLRRHFSAQGTRVPRSVMREHGPEDGRHAYSLQLGMARVECHNRYISVYLNRGVSSSVAATVRRLVRRAFRPGIIITVSVNEYTDDDFRPVDVKTLEAFDAIMKTLVGKRGETADAGVAPPSEWWNRMSRDEQRQYLQQHPHSSHKLTAPNDVGKKGGTKTPHPDAPRPTRSAPPRQEQVRAPDATTAHQPEAPPPDGGGAASHLRPASEDRERWPEHIRALALPPAWTDVRISHDPDADLQAIGKDAKGRSQYVYSEKYARSQAAAKFARIRDLHEQFPDIRARIDRDMAGGDERIRQVAQCMHLVASMGLRPGSENDTGAERQAYGATTLRSSHLARGPDGRTRLRFVGKKGVDLDLAVPDADTARMLEERAREVGDDQPLFPHVDEKRLLDYAHGLGDGSFKTKDFRTHLGTSHAHRLVAEMEPPKNEREYRKALRAVASRVSEKLGNTPSVALASYICPSAFAPWQHAAPSGRNDRVEEGAEEKRPKRSALPLVHYGRVGSDVARSVPLHDEKDDDAMPRRLPGSTIRLLGVDPRRLFRQR